MKTIIASILILIAFQPCSAQWQITGPTDEFLVFGVHDTSLFASVFDGAIGRYEVARITRSQTFAQWAEADNGIDFTRGTVTSFGSLGSNFYASLLLDGVSASTAYLSSDNGVHWNEAIGSPAASNGKYLFATYGSQVARSRDTGKSWQHLDTIPGLSVYGCSGACIFAVNSQGMWRSLDSGSISTWTQVTMPISNIQSFTSLGSIVFALNGSGALIRFTDSGTNWTQITIPRRTITALVDSGRYLFAGTDSGVFISFDSGSSWRAEDDGLGTHLKVSALGVFDTLLFIGANNGATDIGWCVGSRPIREMTDTTSKSAVVATLQLGDMLSIYPNPATGLVTILSGVAIQHVSVMDVLGEDVLDMPNLRNSEIMIDMSKIPSGTYFFLINTDGRSVTRRVVVIK